ncbi:MAG: hypothetical protein ACM3O7_12290, partial [Acidobacteriota bacterium]
HTPFFGLAQVWAGLRRTSAPQSHVRTLRLDRYVRHPMILALFMAFWVTPLMTERHLFMAASIGSIVLATPAFDERSLERHLGLAYRRCRRKVPAFVPHLGRGARAEDLLPAAGEVMAGGRGLSADEAPHGRQAASVEWLLMSAGTVVVAVFFSLVGLAAFRYGRKAGQARPVALGIALMFYGYFFSNAWLALLVGGVLSALIFYPQ